MNWRCFAATAALGVGLAGAASGQAPARASAILDAEESRDFERAVGLLMPVLDPGVAGTDSLWMEGIRVMALVLLEEMDNAERQDPALAPVWLRFGMRHGATRELRIFSPRVQDAFDDAIRTVDADPETEATVETRWDWPLDSNLTAPGRLIVGVGSDESRSPSVAVDGSAVASGTPIELQPGTYRISLSGPGFEPLELDREVLPGVTTRLSIDPVPVLPDDVLIGLNPLMVQLAHQTDASRLCVNALVLDESTILAPSTMLGSQGLELATTGGPASLLGPSRSVEGQELAVFHTSILASEPWPRGLPTQGGYVWAVYRPDCGAPLEGARARIERIQGSSLLLDRQVPEVAIGGAMVSQGGELIGTVVGADRGLLLTSAIQSSLEQAILALREDDGSARAAADSGSGGLPWKWIGGIGALGVGAAALLGGSSSSDSTPPTTGEIVLVVPGG